MLEIGLPYGHGGAAWAVLGPDVRFAAHRV